MDAPVRRSIYLDCAIKGGGGSGLTINDAGVSVSNFIIRDFNYGVDVSAD